MFYIFLADGFEEVEALAPLDFLLRLGVDVKTVAVGDALCRGTHNIMVRADMSIDDISLDDNLQGIILPGGLPGADNLNNDARVQKAIDFCAESNKIIGAICAAPFILGRKGLLCGKNATCFPGFEDELEGAIIADSGVVIDGNIVTGKGAGVAWEFGAAIGSLLVGEKASIDMLSKIQWRK